MMVEQQINHLGQTVEEFEELVFKEKAKVAMIVHNKDFTRDGSLVAPHIHAMLSYSNPRSVVGLADRLGLEPQFVQKWDKRADNGFIYLIHETNGAKDKHQYMISEVKANFDYEALALKLMSKSQSSSKSGTKALSESQKVDQLINSYVKGQLDEEEFEGLLEPCERAKYAPRIQQAHQLREKTALQEWRRQHAHESLEVFYFYGKAGTGKTHLAKMLTGDDAFLTKTSRDPFAGYTSSKHTLVFDDIRPEIMAPSDMLAMLSPFAISDGVRAPARYRDIDLAVGRIFITTPYDPIAYWKKMVGDDESQVDAVEQFLRRITIMIRFERKVLVPILYDPDKRSLVDMEDAKLPNVYGIPSNRDVFDPIQTRKHLEVFSKNIRNGGERDYQ